eukprot:254296_1
MMDKLSLVYSLLLLCVTCTTCAGVSFSPPGNLPVSETPQFVLITIDDYMNDRNSRDVDEVLRIPGHTNPHGGPIPFTFFVSSDASDYHWIQRRHAQGSEIGLHTMTHTTGVDTTAEDWRVELVHLRDALVQLSGIPRADLVGFRAPFLKINHACFKVLSEDDHIMYDASLFFDVRPLAFPHKFTSIGQDFCQSREFAECPVIPHPNLWEVPVTHLLYYDNDLDETGRVLFDPQGSYAKLLRAFKQTFALHYATSHAPLELSFHGNWFANSDNRRALNDFISWATNQPDTWFVTCRQLVEWMQTPVSVEDMNAFPPVQYSKLQPGEEINDGLDNNGDGQVDEGFVRFCEYAGGSFHTTALECPTEYPTPYPSKIGVCGARIWHSKHAYSLGEDVCHNGIRFLAKRWTKSEEPGSSFNDAWTTATQLLSIWKYVFLGGATIAFLICILVAFCRHKSAIEEEDMSATERKCISVRIVMAVCFGIIPVMVFIGFVVTFWALGTGTSSKPVVNVSTVTNKVDIIGYYGNAGGSTEYAVPLNEIACYFNIIILTFANFDATNTLQLSMSGLYASNFDRLKKDILEWKAADDPYGRERKILVSIGGAGAIWPNDMSETEIRTEVVRFLEEFQLDGLDIDLEGTLIDRTGSFVLTIETLMFQGYLVTAGPEAAPSSLDAYSSIIPKLSWVHPQYYNNPPDSVYLSVYSPEWAPDVSFPDIPESWQDSGHPGFAVPDGQPWWASVLDRISNHSGLASDQRALLVPASLLAAGTHNNWDFQRLVEQVRDSGLKHIGCWAIEYDIRQNYNFSRTVASLMGEDRCSA